MHLKNDKDINAVEEQARKVVENGGIFKADVHLKDILILSDQEPTDKTYDIAVSVFCLESACSTHDEYKKALNNIVSIF